MESTVHKTGKIRRGWELTKSSWRVIQLDKELALFPILNAVLSIVVMAIFAVAVVAIYTHGFTQLTSSSFSGNDLPFWGKALFALGLYFSLTLVSNIFSGAIIYGAIDRFKGGDPTVRGSLGATMRKFRPLAMFSLLMATVGLALQMLEERLPLAGKIAVWLLNAAWSIANIFAVPVIVMSEKNVAPLEATRESVRIIRKVWGEGLVAQFGLGAITTLAMLAYMAFWAAVGGAMYALSLTWTPLIVAAVALGVLGMLIIGLVFTTLGSVVKAALYYYALTGQAPETFNQELMRTAMTPKKARKIFA